MRTFFYDQPDVHEDERRCRVCGHLSLTPVRRTIRTVLLIIIGMLMGYIVLDIAHDGMLDGSILRVILEERARLREGTAAAHPR